MIACPAGPTFIIHDDFYPDPSSVRKQALDARFGRADVGKYPGRNAVKRIVDEGIVKRFAQLVGSAVTINDSDAFGVFRLAVAGDVGNYIHSDPVRWGGVLYLNEGSEGGTAFWRHSALGLERHPWENFSDYGFKSEHEAWALLVERDGQDEALWKQTFLVPAKFNRLVLFDSRLYHSHMPRLNFGSSPETGRLVQVFFFETVASSGTSSSRRGSVL